MDRGVLYKRREQILLNVEDELLACTEKTPARSDVGGVLLWLIRVDRVHI